MPLFNQSGVDNKPEKLFEAIGTFYENIPAEAKDKLQTFFESLARLRNGTFYNLYQSELSQYFEFTEGYIELLYKKYRIYFKDLGDSNSKNTIDEFLDAPSNLQISGGSTGSKVYAYRVAAYNSEGETIASDEKVVTGKSSDISNNEITITWDAVEGATGYKVYGRGIKDHAFLGSTTSLSFSDNGITQDEQDIPKEVNTALHSYLYTLPDNLIHLTFGTLVEEGGTELEEGTDFEIVSTDKLRIYNNSITKKTDTGNEALYNEYLCKSSLALSPVLSEFYLKSFGKLNPKEIILDKKYTPHIQGYDGLSTVEKMQALAKHLKYFCWACSYFLRRKPTLKNIENSFGIILDYPFAYEAGEVMSVSGQAVTVEGVESSYTYLIGSGNHHLWSEGDNVDKFDLLVSGVSVDDYYTNKSLIEGLVSATEEPRLAIYLKNEATGFNPDQDLIERFKKVAIPSGLIVKEA